MGKVKSNALWAVKAPISGEIELWVGKKPKLHKECSGDCYQWWDGDTLAAYLNEKGFVPHQFDNGPVKVKVVPLKAGESAPAAEDEFKRGQMEMLKNAVEWLLA